MKTSLSSAATILILFLSPSALHGQLPFWTASGTSTAVNGALDGRTVAGRLGANSYNGYIGELILMPTDSNLLGVLPPGAPGVVQADAGDTYSSVLGIVGFCIDSETPFRVSSSLANTNTYIPYNFAAANSRYNGVNNGSGNGVPFYRDGGLLRAAYLLDTLYDSVHAAGNTDAAALQAAIWEVLYDANPSVATGNGNYFVRNNTGNAGTDAVSNSIIALTDGWFSTANANNWGGPGYDPSNRVIFWLDPTDTDNNQTIITLNPFQNTIAIPEVETPVALALGTCLLMLRRRRK